MIPNPWLILAAVLAFASITGGVYVKGRKDGAAVVVAKQAREDQIRFETLQLAQQAAAEEISRIQIVNKTIYQRAVHEIVEKPVYRDCSHTPDGLRAVNEALTTGAQPASDGVVSGPDATQR